MSDTSRFEWAELHRTDDADEAVTIMTTIASMEFPVRCEGLHDSASEISDPPFVIEVRAEHVDDLHDVLDELLIEQYEFDERVKLRRRRRERYAIVLGILLLAVVSGIVAAKVADSIESGSKP